MDDLKFLKRHYGEKFSHLCRSLFPTILEQKGLLAKIISDHFAPSRSLYDDLLPLQDSFKDYVYGFVDVEQEKPRERVTKTPEELMDEAGYILFPECKTEEDIQKFRKYWRKGEELCTFRGGRLDNCRVWFAVKKDADQIKREDFDQPRRQDRYGTSVISIQFSRRGANDVSIKNRYNHSVNDPDATFGNNLENIAEGLTQAFAQTYGIVMIDARSRRFEIPFYRLGDDGKFHKVNYEALNVCYCENNVVIDNGHVIEYDKARYILAEKYLIDVQKHTITCLGISSKHDAFTDSLGEIESIFTKTDEKGNRVVVFTPKTGENVEVTLGVANDIIAYSNPNVDALGDGFLFQNRNMRRFSAPKLTYAGGDFLSSNITLEELYAPKLELVGEYFLYSNQNLKKVSLPSLKKTGISALGTNAGLEELYVPELTRAEKEFLMCNENLKILSAGKLLMVYDGFLEYCQGLEKFYAPKLYNCPEHLKSALTQTPISEKSDKDAGAGK